MGEVRGRGHSALITNQQSQAHMIRLNLSMFLVRWTQTNSLNGSDHSPCQGCSRSCALLALLT